MPYAQIPPHVEAIGRDALDAGLKVHAALGPGLLESAYENCLTHELIRRNVAVRRQVMQPLLYEGLSLDAGFRIDLLLADSIVIEVKSIDAIAPIHRAQLLTYLKLSRCRLGYVMNFNTVLFKDGVKRMVL